MMEFLIFVAVAFSLPVLVLGLLQLVGAPIVASRGSAAPTGPVQGVALTSR